MQVPAELRDLLRERVQRLGPAVETTLTAAAVIGREFRFAVLRQTADLPDGDLFDALDDALAAHLLAETESGYRFQHNLIRHTLYNALNRRRRMWLHGRTAEAIEASYGQRPEGLAPHVEALAFHYDLSDQLTKALPYLTQAARKARKVFAVEVANDYLERALALMDEVGLDDPAQRWSILRRLGMLATTLADTSRAVARFDEALTLKPTEDWQPPVNDRVKLHRYASRALITAGQADEAERYLQTAMEIIADTDQASLDYAHLLYDVSLWHWHNNEYQEAFETAQRSLDIAEKFDDVQARAQAYEMLALACHSLGEWQQGLGFEQQRSTLVGPNLDVTDAFDVHL
jgi:predicted ATPase